jgi:hypothetical protein
MIGGRASSEALEGVFQRITARLIELTCTENWAGREPMRK